MPQPHFWAPLGPRAPPHCGVCGVSSYATALHSQFWGLESPLLRARAIILSRMLCLCASSFIIVSYSQPAMLLRASVIRSIRPTCIATSTNKSAAGKTRPTPQATKRRRELRRHDATNLGTCFSSVQCLCKSKSKTYKNEPFFITFFSNVSREKVWGGGIPSTADCGVWRAT